MGESLRWWRTAALCCVGGLFVAACAADDPEEGVAQIIDADTTVVVANAPGTLTTNGEQRLLVGLLGDGPNQFLGGPDERAVLVLEQVDGDGAAEVAASWLSNPGVAIGVYTAPVTFSEAGQWAVSIKGADEAVPAALVQVGTDSPVPDPGDPAPASLTLTGSTPEELMAISTDPDPEPDFYDLTIADAVANGRPTVIVFATPAFCQTAVCGPTVDIAKQVAEGRDGVDFVHVEPFDVAAARANDLQPIPAMFEWGLATEPWIFVVDADGAVTARFEGIVGQDELESAIEEL